VLLLQGKEVNGQKDLLKSTELRLKSRTKTREDRTARLAIERGAR
jgi:hypothetical protein